MSTTARAAAELDELGFTLLNDKLAKSTIPRSGFLP